MIYYSDDNLLLFLFQYEGSVLPRAFKWACGNTMIAIALHYVWRNFIPFADVDANGEPDILDSMEGFSLVWAGYTSVLGLFVVFRNNQAYSRFWEGATLVNQLRGEWFNAISSLLSFCSRDAKKAEDVDNFQQLLVRLASLLHCSALQEVCEIAEDSLEVLDTTCFESQAIYFLQQAPDRVEVVVQWLQRLIVDAHREGTLDIAPPILSRSFQELSRGVVNLNNVRKIKDIPFPFPYNQMLVFMLMVHWIITPLLASVVIQTWYWAGISCFFVTLGFWSVIYIAKEIDQPFGEDANDLPMVEMQKDFNRSLLFLLEPQAQAVPKITSFGRLTGHDPDDWSFMTWSDVQKTFSHISVIGSETESPKQTKPALMSREASPSANIKECTPPVPVEDMAPACGTNEPKRTMERNVSADSKASGGSMASVASNASTSKAGSRHRSGKKPKHVAEPGRLTQAMLPVRRNPIVLNEPPDGSAAVQTPDGLKEGNFFLVQLVSEVSMSTVKKISGSASGVDPISVQNQRLASPVFEDQDENACRALAEPDSQKPLPLHSSRHELATPEGVGTRLATEDQVFTSNVVV